MGAVQSCIERVGKRSAGTGPLFGDVADDSDSDSVASEPSQSVTGNRQALRRPTVAVNMLGRDKSRLLEKHKSELKELETKVEDAPVSKNEILSELTDRLIVSCTVKQGIFDKAIRIHVAGDGRSLEWFTGTKTQPAGTVSINAALAAKPTKLGANYLDLISANSTVATLGFADVDERMRFQNALIQYRE